MTIAIDYNQAAWDSSRIYGDGELPGLWIPGKVVVAASATIVLVVIWAILGG